MTTTPRFIQIHFLTTYPASLLNRDDAGFAKRLPYGGAVRTRISSQCQKRHWRTFDGPNNLASIRGKDVMSVRSRYIFDQIAEPLRERFRDAPDKAKQVDSTVKAISDVTLGASDKGEKSEKGKDAETDLKTSQLIVLGYPEITFLRETAEELIDGGEKVDAKSVKSALGKAGYANLEAIGRGAGLDAALFGRMKTSDVLADCDAAVHVAHALTVHGEHTEMDYFTAVDDLDVEGAAHVNASELTSGLFYGYVSVDVALLLSNLEGVAPGDWQQADRTLAGEVIAHLIHLVSTVSPGAKRGGTAPYSFADFVAVEAGDAQPSSWAGAFFSPVVDRTDLREKAVEEIADYLGRLDRMYEPAVNRHYSTMTDTGLHGNRMVNAESIPNLSRWASEVIKGEVG